MSEPNLKTVDQWRDYWDSKNSTDRIALADYYIDGVPMDLELYGEVVIKPNLEALGLLPSSDVLDIGCGTGKLLEKLEGLTSGRVSGTDLSKTLLETYHGRADTYVCPADKQPFQDKSFDRIVMVGVALYFSDNKYFEIVVHEIMRLLRPNGIAVISDMLLGDFVTRSGYRAYNIEYLVSFLDTLNCNWSITNQPIQKRAINKRYNVILKK
jgi:SAM-dependent methyltransferase